MSMTVQFAPETLDGSSLERNRSPVPKADEVALAGITLARQPAYQPSLTHCETADHLHYAPHYAKSTRLAIIAGASLLFWGAIAAAVTLASS